MNLKAGATPLVLLYPAWKRWERRRGETRSGDLAQPGLRMWVHSASLDVGVSRPGLSRGIWPSDFRDGLFCLPQSLLNIEKHRFQFCKLRNNKFADRTSGVQPVGEDCGSLLALFRSPRPHTVG